MTTSLLENYSLQLHRAQPVRRWAQRGLSPALRCSQADQAGLLHQPTTLI